MKQAIRLRCPLSAEQIKAEVHRVLQARMGGKTFVHRGMGFHDVKQMLEVSITADRCRQALKELVVEKRIVEGKSPGYRGNRYWLCMQRTTQRPDGTDMELHEIMPPILRCNPDAFIRPSTKKEPDNAG